MGRAVTVKPREKEKGEMGNKMREEGWLFFSSRKKKCRLKTGRRFFKLPKRRLKESGAGKETSKKG